MNDLQQSLKIEILHLLQSLRPWSLITAEPPACVLIDRFVFSLLLSCGAGRPARCLMAVPASRVLIGGGCLRGWTLLAGLVLLGVAGLCWVLESGSGGCWSTAVSLIYLYLSCLSLPICCLVLSYYSSSLYYCYCVFIWFIYANFHATCENLHTSSLFTRRDCKWGKPQLPFEFK